MTLQNPSLAQTTVSQKRAAFTLIDLVAVMAVAGVITLIMFPALAGNHNNNQAVLCLNAKRQLAVGWLQYAADNNDTLMPNQGWAGDNLDWNSGNFDNFNTARLENPSQAVMAGYLKSAGLFKCPADTFIPVRWMTNRVRSVSMNGDLAGLSGSGSLVQGHEPVTTVNGVTTARTYYGSGTAGQHAPARSLANLNEPGPSRILLILDEHPDSISDDAFLHDPGYPRTQEMFRDLPASYHDNGAGVSYADGHAEIHYWQGQWVSRYGVHYQYPIAGLPWGSVTMSFDPDYAWLEGGMPYRTYQQ